MECNKDEAIRAKQLAEKKLTEKDILGAKRLALKAQSLFPGLDGLSQFQEILDVYASSQKRVNGEVDWYEILGVDPLADNETIRKKYRKLALALHPDKNKSAGADDAFKIISEAWSLLSDKAKRDAYNERRNIRAAYQRARDGNPPAGPWKSASKNFTHSSSKPRNPTAEENSKQDTKASYKKGKGKTSPKNAGKSRYNSFTNSSSSTINPATQGKPKQEARPLYEKDRTGNSPAVAGKSRFDPFTGGSSSKKNPATPDDLQQDTRTSYQKPAHQDTPAGPGKSGHNTFSNGTSSTRNVAAAKSSHTVPSASCGVNRSKTFWTSCKACKMQYEYVRIYRNKKLLCPTCRKSFIAREMSPPHSMGNRSSTKVPCRQKQQGPDDLQQDTRTSYQKAAHQDTPSGDGKSGYNTFSRGASSARNLETAKNSHTVPSAPCGVNRSKTFWTSCKACKMQYEYVHIYRNKKLLCPTCQKPFIAREMPPLHSMGRRSSTKVPCRQKQQVPIHNSFDTSSNSGMKSVGASGYPSFKSMGSADIPPVSPSRHDGARSESISVTSALQPEKNFQSTNVNLKRRHEQKVDVAVNEETLCKKRTAPVKHGSDIGSNFSK